MKPLYPRNRLHTHTVDNIPGEPAPANLFTDDPMLVSHVRAAGGQSHELHLAEFGANAGSERMIKAGMLANRNPPVFTPFDRFGQRLDEVEFHPAYHELMALGIDGGTTSRAWSHPDAGHVAHCALLFMMSQAETGVTCPMSMTYAALPALKHAPNLASVWEPLVLASVYDPQVAPASRKSGVTIGMAMTEKQGGSDVRANTTQAQRISDTEYELTGHKWFCSAPMSDAFLTLANTPEGLACFLVPRWRPDEERNSIEIQRLKDKLGDRANASAEIEYHGAYAEPVGEPGRGIATIIEMVNHTRLDCVVGATSLMRQSLSLATFHVQHRQAFGRRLVDQALMQRVIADMALEVEGHMAALFLLAETFDQSREDEPALALARSLTPILKYWSTKRCPVLIAEAMECLGGAGFVEEHLMPRLYRQAPLNGIWEGSGNVIALDVLRAFQKEPSSLKAVLSLLAMFGPRDSVFSEHCQQLTKRLSAAVDDEGQARWHVEQLAKTLTVCALYHRGSDDLAHAYARTRLFDTATTFGGHGYQLDATTLLSRASVFRQ
ncbi:MAG: DNA alkylation response protein [Gammaproteobacteria bacterium]|nr:DNA alkylation response protein [Gammaproteobacteria bacterium]